MASKQITVSKIGAAPTQMTVTPTTTINGLLRKAGIDPKAEVKIRGSIDGTTYEQVNINKRVGRYVDFLVVGNIKGATRK